MEKELLENLKKIQVDYNRICLSVESTNRIKDKIKNKKRTLLYKKILLFNCVLCLALIISVPITVYAAYEGMRVLYEKTQNADLSQEEIIELDAILKDEHFSEEDISKLNDLNRNESGQLYGPDILGAELIEVESDLGDVGYIYRSDLEEVEADNIEEALGKEEAKVVLTVYKNDGVTKIGTFTLN